MKYAITTLLAIFIAAPAYATCTDSLVALDTELPTVQGAAETTSQVRNGVGAAAWARRGEGTMCRDLPAAAGCREDMSDSKPQQGYYTKVSNLRAAVASDCAGQINENIRLVRDKLLADVDFAIAWLHAMEDTE